ncbi:MAG: glycosyltransferase family 2 protein [Deltaproteobacteria bacterium]|nr:glycosyltransferase family 2 protein [Deltaproteobacteria bacterium]
MRNTEKKKQKTLSVIVITKNEEDRIGRCLESVASLADEIIVLDSGSTDATVDIAKKYTDKVFVTNWPGYGLQKQRALEKASCEWVLSIDADEALSRKLYDEIARVLSENPDVAGFKLPWAVVVFGQTLNHGRSARAPLRLFRSAGARFSDDIVHEKIILPPGRVKKLSGRLYHYTHRDFGHYLQKNREYAWLGSKKRHAAGRRGAGLFVAALRALWTFFSIYIIRLGFLDGPPGFLVAVMYAQGNFNKYAGLWSLRRMERLGKQQGQDNRA